MTLKIYQNGVQITNGVNTDSLVIEESADHGTIATWSMVVDDPAGTITLSPHVQVQVEETTSIYGTRLSNGFFINRGISRSDTSLTSNARKWDPQIVDINATLGFRVISTTTFHHSRPAETDVQRIHWLLGSSASVLPLLHDNGFVATTGGWNMSANDYAGQFPIDVLNDCAAASGRTFFVYWDQTNAQYSLFYRKPTDAVFTSPIQVSNFPGEANNSTIFAPLNDAELRLDPAHFYSGVYMPYSGGVVYPRTTGRTIARDVVAPSADTTSRAKALARAERLLADYQTEEGALTFTIRVPNTHVNAIVAGQRVQVRFSHLPGYASYTYVRVVHRTIKPAPNSNNLAYDLTLECNEPIPVGPGSAPGNSTVWPSNQVPFVPSGGGSFTFVQAAKTANGSLTTPTATFGVAPTSGSLLIGLLLMQQPGGSPSPTDFTADWPEGWAVDIGPVGTAVDGRLLSMWVAHKTAGVGEPSTVAPSIFQTTLPANIQNGFLVMGEYSTGGGTPSLDVSADGALQGPSNTGTLNALTPTSGNATLIVQCLAHDPDYTSTPVGSWVSRSEFLSLGGPRQALALVDQIIASANGSPYAGTATVPGLGESSWYIPAVAFQLVADTPAQGQPVTTDSSITASGSAVTTTYPYATKSLLVTVNGILQNVTETDPTLGGFDLGFVPRAGVDVINVRYISSPAPATTPGV